MDGVLQGEKAWQAYLKACQMNDVNLPAYEGFASEARVVFALSPFVARYAAAWPQAFATLFSSGLMHRQDEAYPQTLYSRLEALLSQHDSEAERDRILRIFRQGECVRIVWQQALGQGDFYRHANELSALAEAIISLTLADCHRRCCQERGVDPEYLSSLMVIGMGKLGGGELNFSSDIDLIFVHPEDGEVENARGRSYQVSMLYTQIGQRFIGALHRLTAEGFVYRVDMRLRPFGEGSPLTLSCKAFERYTIKDAREWERYALIKARVLTGDRQHCQQLQQIITDFVYRPYYDYKMLAAIRGMKQMIMTQVQKKNLRDHIKLGRGGIREIEFVVQCFQLIYGGQAQDLRTQALHGPLIYLGQCGHLAREDVHALLDSYLFLRNVENALQMQGDDQKHCLPLASQEQARVLGLMQYEQWQSLYEAIDATREQVAEIFNRVTHFDEVLAGGRAHPIQSDTAPMHSEQASPEERDSLLVRFQPYAQLLNNRKGVSSEARNLIERLLSLLERPFNALATIDHATVFQRLARLLVSIARRPNYLYLLIDHHHELEHLLVLLDQGPWFSNKVTEFPFLLDYILMPREQAPVRDVAWFTRQLRFELGKADSDDMETQMELLRKFKLTQTFLVAAAEVHQQWSLMQSSDVLSFLAEAVIDVVLEQAWNNVLQKSTLSEDQAIDLRHSLAVIGYGKLGGYELSYASDLDLIFLYAPPASVLEAGKWFTRVAQRFISLMQAQTYSGTLYEIDVRLRPEGSAGLLVSSVSAYAHYQRHKAWSWEHQAMVRARFISGSETLRRDFEQVRADILARERNQARLIRDIVAMRARMRDSLLKVKAGQFDLKQSPGGMVDIEFLAQFFALAYSSRYYEIGMFPDNIRIFQSMETAGFLPREQADQLIEAYCFYRRLSSRCTFHNQPARLSPNELQGYPEKICQLWQHWLGNWH